MIPTVSILYGKNIREYLGDFCWPRLVDAQPYDRKN